MGLVVSSSKNKSFLSLTLLTERRAAFFYIEGKGEVAKEGAQANNSLEANSLYGGSAVGGEELRGEDNLYGVASLQQQ